MAIQHNVRETDQLDQDELVEVTAAANAWVSIKRTFEMWATIGRGVQRRCHPLLVLELPPDQSIAGGAVWDDILLTDDARRRHA